jgi:gamma-glutamyltranspeptidase/glutathione hydrolase
VETLSATGGAVTTPHPQAAAAALHELNSGGNAVDAAVAAMLAVCVLTPDQVAIGGYGGAMVVYEASQKSVACIDFDARAPKAYKPQLYQKPSVTDHGYLALAVPGVVAGLDLALRTFGTRSWRDVSAHALRLAEDGIIVDQRLVNSFKYLIAHADRASVRAILPDAKLPPIRAKWVQKDLAKLLRQLADDPASFYHGDIPHRIVQQVQANGGILSQDDFASYQARAVEPVHISYRGRDLYTPPPPAGGLTTFSILKTLESFEISKLDRWGAPYFELFIEAAKMCWEERARYLGDPDFVRVPIDELLSDKTAHERAARIRAGKWVSEHRIPAAGVHTVNIVAIDSHRNLVSLTATQGNTWGACVAIEGLGLALGHGMSRFTYAAQNSNSPNAPAPGKRMQHNMSPTVITKNGNPFAAIGLPGGTRIVTVTGQLVCSLLDFAATPGEAVTAPRVHTDGGEPLLCSPAVAEEVAAELELMGHQVRRNQPIGGPANIALLDPGLAEIRVATGSGPQHIALAR